MSNNNLGSKEVLRENKMGVMPVNRLLISMALPMMASMLVQALYNIVDSIFVAKISENALTAVSMAFPIQNLMIAVSVGIGVGMNAMLSRYLGEGSHEKANKTAMQGIFLVGLGYLFFLVFGLFAAEFFFKTQTDIPEIIEGGTAYLRICSIFCFGLFGEVIFERILISTGKTFYSMITQGLGAIINIILDPIMIFGYFGFPKMGIAGAAAATVIGQIIAFMACIFFNQYKNKEIRLEFKGFRPDGAIIKKVLSVGVPSMVMQSIGSIMNFGMNQILLAFSSTATAVFGIYFKLQSFVFMPVFGLNNGMVPIVAYNLGARKKDRMMKVIWLSMIYAIGIMLIGLCVIQFFPVQMLKMFEASEAMLSIGVPALRLISLSFLLAGFGIISSSVFQALGNGVYSMLVSIVRQLVVLLPAAYLLSLSNNVNLVWWAFPIAEGFSALMSVIFLIRIKKKVINTL